MTHPIRPCLWFDGQAQEAASFYCAIFPTSKIVSSTPMVAIFELNGKKMMGLDAGPEFKINPAISFFVFCPTAQETDECWDKLMAGGKALMTIDKYPWSERYGWVQDKFGVTWQIMLREQDQLEITPALMFTADQFGRGEEAIQWYSSIFDKSAVSRLERFPVGDANAGKVLYSEFSLDGDAFIAMDGPGVHDWAFNEGVSLVVTCDTQAEIDHFWEKLTDGGQEGKCGWLKDKFGVSWQVVPSILGELMRDPEKAPKAMYAFMQMKKFDIAKLAGA